MDISFPNFKKNFPLCKSFWCLLHSILPLAWGRGDAGSIMFYSLLTDADIIMNLFCNESPLRQAKEHLPSIWSILAAIYLLILPASLLQKLNYCLAPLTHPEYHINLGLDPSLRHLTFLVAPNPSLQHLVFLLAPEPSFLAPGHSANIWSILKHPFSSFNMFFPFWELIWPE